MGTLAPHDEHDPKPDQAQHRDQQQGCQGRHRDRQPVAEVDTPPRRDPGMDHQRRHAHRRQKRRDASRAPDCPASRVAVQVVGGLHHKPGGAQQRIARHQPGRDQQGVGREPVERPAREPVALDRHPLDESPQDQTLGHRRQDRPASEHLGPEFATPVPGPEAELERHAAQDKPRQHQQHRQIQRRHQHRIGQGEGRQQPPSPQHQPGLVAVPHGGDGVHHHVALAWRPGEGEQDADPEVEPVQHDVEQHRRGDQPGPDQRKIKGHFGPPSTPSGPSSPGVVSSGALASGVPGAR